MFIDCTGAGDLAEWTGAPSEKGEHKLGLVMKLVGVDWNRFRHFTQTDPKAWQALRDEHLKRGGIGFPSQGWRDDVVWVNNLVPGDALSVHDLTRIEVEVREGLIKMYDFFKERVPGFEKSLIMDVAPQVGTRESRRIQGEYILTEDDLAGREFPDSIGQTGNWLRGGEVYSIPYRCIVPKQVENLLFAGRCISTTHEAHDATRVIVPCMITGQAAGAAAALALADDVSPRSLDVARLQSLLEEQGVNV